MKLQTSILFASVACSSVSAFTPSPAFGFRNIKQSVTNSSSLKMGLADILGLGGKKFDEPCVMGDESIMSPKAHGKSKQS